MVLLRHLTLFLSAIAALSTATAAGPSPVGTWKGRIVDIIPTGKPTPQLEYVIKTLKASVTTLTVKADKTFNSIASSGRTAKPQVGTWSQSGNTVTLKQTGRPAMTLLLSSNGKSMSMKLPPSGGLLGKAVFTRS